MSISLEVDSAGADVDIEDSFMILNDSAPTLSDESQSEFSDSSFLDIDLDDEIEDEEIDTTESIEVEVNQELKDVSSYMIGVIPELHYEIPFL